MESQDTSLGTAVLVVGRRVVSIVVVVAVMVVAPAAAVAVVVVATTADKTVTSLATVRTVRARARVLRVKAATEDATTAARKAIWHEIVQLRATRRVAAHLVEAVIVAATNVAKVDTFRVTALLRVTTESNEPYQSARLQEDRSSRSAVN